MRLVLWLKTFFMKLIYRVFGSTWIFIFILGWFLVLTGIWMLLEPERARKKIAAQGFGFFKFYLLTLALFVAMLLVSVSAKVSGLLSLVILVAGIALVVRMYYRVRATASLKFIAWAQGLSVRTVKTYAVIQIILGACMLVLRRRIFY